MMKTPSSYLATLLALVCMTTIFGQHSHAQTRYLDNVFTDVTVTSNVVYGNNISILSGTPSPSDLKMDLYEPMGDSVTDRPVVIVMHTGNFLPSVFNGSPTGLRTDKSVVGMCTQLARRGYVAVAMSYRLGWNPLSTDQDVRTGTIINAAFRAVQDAHTCVRFFRMDATLNGNTYGVDTSKFVIGGIGTGGYVSLGFDAFDDFQELEQPKFLDFSQSPPVPYIDTAVSGDFNGEWARPLNTPNHVGYNNAANMIFNLGGAMGDTSWMAAGDLPIVTFHSIKDPNAPYHFGAVIVPTTGDFVLDASGGHSVIWNANNLGNNDVFTSETYSDCFSMRADMVNDGRRGLFAFQTPAPGGNICTDGVTVFNEQEQGSPWDWWDPAVYISTANAIGKDGNLENCKSLLSNPDMSQIKAERYMDTIVGYLLPRMYKVLFGTFVDGVCLVGIDGPEGPAQVAIYPNPSNSNVNISTEELIRTIELYDVSGRVVYTRNSINSREFVLSKEEVIPGMYFVKITTDYGQATTKIIFE
ncbi:MAG: T9SS type A sorting domain-containing protein [Flavobacteriales bacterium]|nr:T9SS type A sorting domain-containing protein [Flavobacteriales bacterium]